MIFFGIPPDAEPQTSAQPRFPRRPHRRLHNKLRHRTAANIAVADKQNLYHLGISSIILVFRYFFVAF